MMHVRFCRFVVLHLFAFTLVGPTGAADVEEVELTVYPRATTEPALKHRLLPTFLEERPGNAAPMYLKALLMLAAENVDAKAWEDVTRWAELPLEEIPRDEARGLLDRFQPILSQVQAAALRKHCEWNLAIRDSPQPFAIQLPEVMRAREVARLLALQVRLEIAEGQIDQAVATLRTGFALARHVSQQPTLISGLVGIAIVHMMTAQMEALVQLPEAPALYWSLTALPSPLADLRPGLRFEEVSLYVVFPRLTEVDSGQYTADQWDHFAQDLYRKARAMNTLVGEPDKVEWLKNLDPAQAVAIEYPRAKRELQRRGYSNQQIEAMPQSKVVLLDMSLSYRELRDEVFKWFFVPIWQASAGHDDAEAQLKPDPDQGISHRFFELLIPTVRGAHDATARAEQQIALLRMIEAIRIHVANQGGLPESASDITDVPVPIDPFTGQPFKVRLEEGKAVLDTLQRRGQLIRRYRVSIAR